MATEPFLLTIAIPTYNRSLYLARLLESLVPQLNGESRVELIISDNASPDETPATMEEFRLRGLVFRGIRNHENIGAEANFVQCFTQASGRYVWIVGDDDVILPRGVEVVLGLLASSEFDLVHLRAAPIVAGAEPRAPTRQPRIEIVHDPVTFALRTHVFLTFITSNIIDKRRVSELPHLPFTDIIGTGLVQLSWTYTVLRHFRKGAVVHDCLVAGGGDENRGGYALVTIFGTNLKRITEAWLVDAPLVRIILNGAQQVFFPTYLSLARSKASGFTDEDPDQVLRPLFFDNWRYHLFIYPVLTLPLGLARLWVLLCRVANRLDKILGNPMLR
ncbi:putative glycosyltransferase [Acidisarcina polymorpha]|uniref:Putative glycosyltransferase n=1 Tax=Acidisarcina polymorpha TaxID=2211140 RepID=A0A2Z5FXA3_9BACT|nr:glycosyltransferase family 2 protein [Acidisarcina polymorpha]AXC11513.1 putative glycosyltransferase [Acidisarcina polymorpha]